MGEKQYDFAIPNSSRRVSANSDISETVARRKLEEKLKLRKGFSSEEASDIASKRARLAE